MDTEERKYLENNEFSDDYKVITFPESQNYMDYTEDDDVYLINDEVGLDLFGSSAYVVPNELILNQ